MIFLLRNLNYHLQILIKILALFRDLRLDSYLRMHDKIFNFCRIDYASYLAMLISKGTLKRLVFFTSFF